MVDRSKVSGESSLVRDNRSGAILQTDYDAFLTRKAKKKEIDKIHSLEKRIEALEKIVRDLTRGNLHADKH